MSEDKKSLINLFPDSIDNAIKNITDKPTQNIGTTLADILYLIFGGISQAAEKRKLKYYYELQEFENELKNKIDKIPKDKQVELDIQIIAPALEAAKFCIEKPELRILFANLITAALNQDKYKYTHPSFCDVIKQMTPLDAKNIFLFSKQSYYPICNYRVYYRNNRHDDYYKNIFISNKEESDLIMQSVSISSLESLGLIKTTFTEHLPNKCYKFFKNTNLYNDLKNEIHKNDITKAKRVKIVKGIVKLTPYGELFIKVCISN